MNPGLFVYFWGEQLTTTDKQNAKIGNKEGNKGKSKIVFYYL